MVKGSTTVGNDLIKAVLILNSQIRTTIDSTYLVTGWLVDIVVSNSRIINNTTFHITRYKVALVTEIKLLLE